MTWTQSGEHAYVSGTKAISKKYDDGCTMYCAHDGKDYVKHSEDEAEAVLALITEKVEMRQFLDVVRSAQGKEYAENLRQKCLELWKGE